MKAHPEIYKFVPKNQRFDYFEDTPYYDFECQVIRFKITEDTYEYIVTNLDKDEFVIQDIKELYHLRCKIETSYRELKYDLDSNTLHAEK
ncbi:transposase [Holdemanella biformis]|uniref:transposase n=1 Tax=Holdemanella biformis TaxID=1735 RepID=UPI003AB63CA7